MKSLLLLLLISGLGLHAFGQICNTYYFMKANSTVEQSHFDEKGKLSLKTEYKVGEVTPVDNRWEAAVMQKVVDKNGKIISEGKTNIRYDGDNLFMNKKHMMPVGPVAPGGNVEATSRKVYMPYTKNMKPGDKLENAQFSM